MGNRRKLAAVLLASAGGVALLTTAAPSAQAFGSGADVYYHYSCQLDSTHGVGADVYEAYTDATIHTKITEWHYATTNPTWRAARATVSTSPANQDSWTLQMAAGGTTTDSNTVPQSFDNNYNVTGTNTSQDQRMVVYSADGAHHVSCTGVLHTL